MREQETRAEAERTQRAEYSRKFELLGKLGQTLREANLMREFAGALKQAARSPIVPVEQKAGGPAFDFDLRVPHLSGRLTGGGFDLHFFIGNCKLQLPPRTTTRLLTYDAFGRVTLIEG